jgi:hypothetical protein
MKIFYLVFAMFIVVSCLPKNDIIPNNNLDIKSEKRLCLEIPSVATKPKADTIKKVSEEEKMAQAEADRQKNPVSTLKLVKKDEFLSQDIYQDNSLKDYQTDTEVESEAIYLRIIKNYSSGLRWRLQLVIRKFHSLTSANPNIDINIDNKISSFPMLPTSLVSTGNGNVDVYKNEKLIIPLIQRIVKSKKTIIRLKKGDDYSDKKVAEEEKEAINNTLKAYLFLIEQPLSYEIPSN